MPSNGCPLARVEKNMRGGGFHAGRRNFPDDGRGRGVKAPSRTLLKFDRGHAGRRVAVGRTMMIGTHTVLARCLFVFARRFGAKVVLGVMGRRRVEIATRDLDSPIATVALQAVAVVMMPAAAQQSVRQDGSGHQTGQQTLQGAAPAECIE